MSSILPPRCLSPIFIAHRAQQSHCSSSFHRESVAKTQVLAFSASQFLCKKKSPRIYTSIVHSEGFELAKLTCTRLEDDLIRHRDDRLDLWPYEYTLGGIRTHETDLYQARGLPDKSPGRPARPMAIRLRPPKIWSTS